ncbi:acyltransferase family protein [Shinella sp. M31]|uniref:acyltransferase family protein n=1 Tax=Shinella sp. M31 TaxID=3368615 RepID=UPI003BA2F07F
MTAKPASGTLYGIQYLRALAALAVVAFHAAERTGYAFAIGAAGVDVFFVISGFIMWVIVKRRPVSPGRFLLDRIRRIVPVYWLATGVMVAGALAGLFPNLVLTAGHVAASLAFVPARSPSSGEIWPVLVQGWTLNYEMFFYLVFAACLALPQRLRLPGMAGLFGMLVVLGLLVESDAPLFLVYTRPIILEFVAGMLIARLWLDNQVPGRPLAFALVGLGLAGFAAIGVLRLPFDEWTCGPLACALVYGTAALEKHRGIPRLALPVMLGDASYSIYLWHTFAISVTAKAGTLLGMPPALAFILSICAGLALGLVAYRLIERPLLRAGKEGWFIRRSAKAAS